MTDAGTTPATPAGPLPAVDVVVLTIDRLEDVQACIDSVLAQDHPEVHLFLLDQGSAPATVATLATRAETEGFDFLPIERIGVGPGRNLGTALGQAPVVVALDNDATLADPLGHWCVAQGHQDAQAELALATWGQFGPLELTIDRTFIFRGDRWIIDYKSAAPEAGEDLETWVQDQLRQYSGQLTRYRQALSDSVPPGGSLRAALYFTALSSLWETTPDTDTGVQIRAEQLLS